MLKSKAEMAKGKLQKLIGELKQYFEEGDKLEKQILENLRKIKL